MKRTNTLWQGEWVSYRRKKSPLLCARVLHSNARKSKIALDSDSTPWFPDSRHWIPVSDGASWIPDHNRWWDSRFQGSWFWIPQTKFSQIPDSTSNTSRILESGFSYMGRSVPGVTLKDWGQRIRPFPIVVVKYLKVAHWDAKKLLPKYQKLPPKFLDHFI